MMTVTNAIDVLDGSPEHSFLNIAKFNDGNFGCCQTSGQSPVWEMHPDTDEFFYIIEGEFEITLLTGTEEEKHVASAGSVFVVPKGIWHKPAAPKGAKFLFYTPGQSLHSESKNPLLD